MEHLRFLSKYLVLTTALIGLIIYLINHKKNEQSSSVETKYFLLSLFVMAGFDFFGSKFTEWFGMLNYPVYSTYIVTFMLFYYYWYYRLIKPKLKRRLIKIFAFTFLIYAIINATFIQNFYTGVQSYTYALGVIFLIITICFYFIEIFKSDLVLKITKSTLFWFSLGILLFHGTFLPFQVAHKFFLLGDSKIFSVVLFFLNFIMCLCFVIGFFNMRKSIDNETLDLL